MSRVVAFLCILIAEGLGFNAYSLTTSSSIQQSASSRRRSSSLLLTRQLPLRSQTSEDNDAIQAGPYGEDLGTSEEVGRQVLQKYFNFPLDSWQAESGGEILRNKNLIVTAATGSGKTVVGEMALHIAFQSGKDAIYTTPLKALNNQKFSELRAIFGAENVGLLTGDMSINRGARITVMTTEVYRNMAWRAGNGNEKDDDFVDRELANVAAVVLDEFHYMGQAGRGGVWEECVITSPEHTQIIGLSATLPNADQLSSWMQSVTSRETALVVADGERPVPLRYFFGTRDGIEPLFSDIDAGPGSPKGLLGLRGDGISNERKPKKKKKNGGPGKNKLIVNKSGGLPEGLQLNNKLMAMKQRRLEKVNRIITRKMLRDEFDDKKTDYKPRLRPKQEQKERERLLKSEMRKSIPSLSYLLRGMKQRDLLPAIFFIFSRKGCEEAATAVCRDMKKKIVRISEESTDGTKRRKGRGRGPKKGKRNIGYDKDGRSFRLNSKVISEDSLSAIFDNSDLAIDRQELNPFETDNIPSIAEHGLLSVTEIEQVIFRVKTFNTDNEEIKFDDETVENFLFGVGSHHAGQLPAHKAFVEALFRSQLMKVVFATETLAAGINMPARSTVICSMAKRGGDASMHLLETSNLLQMAGRAGRRGMDTDGACLIVATTFEGPEEAIQILTDEIKPISSQFSPSYSLAVNLVKRGGGKLFVAKNLLQKSFAMWNRNQVQKAIDSGKESDKTNLDELATGAARDGFLNILEQTILNQENLDGKKKALYERVLTVLQDKPIMKKASKEYESLSQMYNLEMQTLRLLQKELNELTFTDTGDDSSQVLRGLFGEDKDTTEKEIETQRGRVDKWRERLSGNPLTAIAVVGNELLRDSSPRGLKLRHTLTVSRKSTSIDSELLTPDELVLFVKDSFKIERKRRKKIYKGSDGSGASLLNALAAEASTTADSWEDLGALINVLKTYGCIEARNETVGNLDMDNQVYDVTVAGENVGMLGFENSLWCIVALGGAWDVVGTSSVTNKLRAEKDNFEDFDSKEFSNEMDLAQTEASDLISHLRNLEPCEMAGYVSCLVADSPRGGGAPGINSFLSLSTQQQRVIQSSLNALERLAQVQNKFRLNGENNEVNLELRPCKVVTEWAAGCSWSEALEISGSAPGDLVRTLHRALDALRQFGNLPVNPARAVGRDSGVKQEASPGIHPDIRRLCKDAASAMDRYPVKDPLPFEEEEEVLEKGNEETDTERPDNKQ